MSKVLNVPRNSFYHWLRKEPSKRRLENGKLTVDIIKVHQASRQIYGSPRIAKELQSQGIAISRPRVARLMQAANIRSILRKKYVATTDSKHKYPVALNLLDRKFQAGQVGRFWVSDTTYIRTLIGWAYLTTVIDLGDRKVIGWKVSSSLTAEETAIAAYKKAIRNRPITQPLIFHSDRGVQYACNQFTELLAKNSLITQSMSRRGNCWDNAVAESFFKTIKHEWVNRFVYKNHHAVELSVFDYIESYYNTNRRHSALQNMTLIEFNNYLNQSTIAA